MSRNTSTGALDRMRLRKHLPVLAALAATLTVAVGAAHQPGATPAAGADTSTTSNVSDISAGYRSLELRVPVGIISCHGWAALRREFLRRHRVTGRVLSSALDRHEWDTGYGQPRG